MKIYSLFMTTININFLFWQRFICVLLIIFFSQPYLAELSFKNAKQHLANIELEQAVRYFELARRLTPWNHRYYYHEAAYWQLSLSHQTGGVHAAERANDLLAQAVEVNPFDMKSLLSRAVLHRDHGELLKNVASNKVLLGWFEKVMEWRPNLPVAQYEYLSMLKKLEQHELAEIKLKEFLAVNPASPLLLDFQENMNQ